jgi:hypothetical protein
MGQNGRNAVAANAWKPAIRKPLEIIGVYFQLIEAESEKLAAHRVKAIYFSFFTVRAIALSSKRFINHPCRRPRAEGIT